MRNSCKTIATPAGVSQVAYDTDQKLAVSGSDKHLRLYTRLPMAACSKTSPHLPCCSISHS